MAPRRELIVALSALTLLVLIAQAVGREGPADAEERDPRVSTLRAGPDGARALADALGLLGVEVRRWKQRPQFLSPDSAGGREALVLLGPSFRPSVPSMTAILRLADSGAAPMDLVLAGEGAGRLMGCFGYGLRRRWLDSLRVVAPGAAPDADDPWTRATLVRRGERVFADSSRLEDIGAFSCPVPAILMRERLLETPGREPVAIRLVREDGGGDVILLADAGLARNRVVRSTEAGPHLLKLFQGRYRRVIFDEYHHGFGPSGSMAGAVVSWSKSHPLGWAVWQLALVGLLALAISAVRFGPARRVIERRRRSPLEHVRALAAALAAARGHDIAIAALVRGLRRRLLPAGQRASGDSSRWLDGVSASVRSPRGKAALDTLRDVTRPGQPADGVRRAALAVEDLWEDLRS